MGSYKPGAPLSQHVFNGTIVMQSDHIRPVCYLLCLIAPDEHG